MTTVQLEKTTVQKPDKAQYGVCGFLAGLGALVIFDATGIANTVSPTDVVGSRAIPFLLGILLLVVAVIYGIDVARGGRGEPEAGEDIDLDSKMDWRTGLLLVAVFAVNAVLIEPLGWVISGALLFWGAAFALGSRRYLLTTVISVTLSLTTFYVFAIGLGVNLPAGILQGIL